MTTNKENLELQVLPDMNLFVFPDTMSEANRNAAKACHSLATQGANRQHHPIQETQAWFNQYVFLMSKMGWTPTRVDVQRITQSDRHLEISNLIGKGLQAAYGAFTGDVASALEGLGKTVVSALAASTKNVELLDRKSVEDDRNSLSLNKCEQTGAGQVAMMVSAVQTDAKPDKKANYLLAKWESSGTTNYACGAVLNLDQRQYEKVRAVVETKLDDNALEVLLALEI
ncbi:hypothetical protein CWR53_02530 [Pseudomonas sp. SGAir0191]|uniref:hypothetical protein n=1 Tax=Pseudomonas TaxID=286 RepID=UPI000734D69B|nr:MULTISPECIES: hypothetical protein [Pseudomonas]AUA31552.1 hypothetical protein CWR53_02530 [Pseudomonas sp. SGAir0191]KTT00762.1 hypothetical protein NS212_05215 [Pseudomonas parafulva]